MSSEPPKKSWAALAQSNAKTELTKIVPVITESSSKAEGADLPLDVNPFIASVFARENEDDELGDIEEEWRKDPFGAFKQGVAVVFLLWDALQLIIDHAFVDEAAKMSDILEYDTIEVFINTKGKIGPEDLEVWLTQTIERNFFTIIEDGSTLQTTRLLCDLYQDIIKKKDFTSLHELMQRAFETMGEGEGEGEGDYYCDGLFHNAECVDEQDHGDDGDYYNEDEDGDLEDYDEDEDDDKDDHDEEVGPKDAVGPKAVEKVDSDHSNCNHKHEKQSDKKQVDDDGWTVNPSRRKK